MRPGAVLAGLFALIAAFWVLIWINNADRPKPVSESNSGAGSGDPVDGIYTTNPFADETPDPAPHVEFEENIHEFEPMAVGSTQSHTFFVQNNGEGVLKLAQGRSTCKCTVGSLGQDEVPPGETTEIELEWRPVSPDPMFSQTATIYTNDPGAPELTLVVEGIVANWTMTFPGQIWTRSAVSESEETPFEFIVASQLMESFEITGIETSNDLLQVEATPIAEEDLLQYENARSGYRLNGRIGLGFPVGPIRENLTVSTDIEQQERIRLQIETARIGPYQVIGPGWSASTKQLRMGRFDAAAGKTVKISFLVEEDEDTFQFTDVHIEPAILDVSWEVDAAFESPTHKRIRIEVAAAPGITPGRWVDDETVKVTLSTNDPEVVEWPFSVSPASELADWRRGATQLLWCGQNCVIPHARFIVSFIVIDTVDRFAWNGVEQQWLILDPNSAAMPPSRCSPQP